MNCKNRTRDRCIFTSILLLGSLFALSASPCAGLPLITALVIIGVPLMTFGVAAPTRLGLISEIALIFRGAESFLLTTALRFVGRKRDAHHVRDLQRQRVVNAYVARGGPLAGFVDADPLRFHHARRLANFAAFLSVFAGVGLPFVFPSTYTFGDFPEAPLVFGLDFIVFALAGRLVGERISIRLFEATHIRGSAGWTRTRLLPLAVMLGTALGAVGALVVVSAGAMACAIETSMMDSAASFIGPAFWFIRSAAPEALPLGIFAGAILGAGMALAQPPGDDD